VAAAVLKLHFEPDSAVQLDAIEAVSSRAYESRLRMGC